MIPEARIAELEAENAGLRARVEALAAQVQELQARLAKDSRNSGKPPSSDGLGRKAKSLRKRSGKKPGGQLGHRGQTLRLVAAPDAVVEHRPVACAHCQASLEGAPAVGRERRQVHDLPPLRLHVWEHQALHLRCSACQRVSAWAFPAEAPSRAQYGPRLRALAVYLVDQEFACEADAQAELHRRLKTLPVWLQVQSQITPRAHYASKGRPAKGEHPAREGWHVEARVTRDAEQLAPNVLDAGDLPDEGAIGVYKAQSGVERGFAFLQDPLFLASSVFLKKPERTMALALIMVLGLLVYRLGEWRLRHELAHTQQTVPNQLRRPTDRPTMRWMFECFEGISLLTSRGPGSTQTLVHGLEPLHALVVGLLGSAVSQRYTGRT